MFLVTPDLVRFSLRPSCLFPGNVDSIDGSFGVDKMVLDGTGAMTCAIQFNNCISSFLLRDDC